MDSALKKGPKILYKEKIDWIDGTPLGLNVRRIEFVPAHLHDGLIEIILCIKGSIKFSYAYEDFFLREGEFISVDKDAHYLQKTDEDNICVSFYIDLNYFTNKHPNIKHLLFVCEAIGEKEKRKNQFYQEKVKGIMIAILFFIANKSKYEKDFNGSIIKAASGIIEIFMNHFDITFFYAPELKSKGTLMERNHEIMAYLQTHSSERITLDDLAKNFNLTKSYVSEFLRTYEIGFRKSLSYIRANNSEKLLLETDMNITDISLACGFSDAKYYYEAFKKWYKCTPSEFRKIYKNKMRQTSSEVAMEINTATRYINEMLKNHYLDTFLFEIEEN